MVKNVPQWDDMALEECVEPMDTGTPKSEADGRLRFDTFDIRRVLDRGHALLGSSGKEYEYKRDDQTSKEKYVDSQIRLKPVSSALLLFMMLNYDRNTRTRER
ncbi:hypothetical protein SARC_11821 [Sphaeroforma arctica JP610]|uniref:Uncharacterized protein n=1 Tax=Sphaeroforma arctica JP610 TaxID=667725 RepID=A0A0L0FGS9_9EUKA|nr:hypothetical protein SARC_11821 [Sphaeroforma arctica JP610]KNC75661.1 hypothetical protein SARC_11821 [Sphaeroforma arctica JP610]|eukprot:XP_014149563.1 hypothetical protein SARC_11821 [Sphaeroforma arctica JP610]